MKIFKLKFLTVAIVAVCLCGAFTSCSDDDDDNAAVSLVGTWQGVTYVYWWAEDGEVVGDKDKELDYTWRSIVFTEDGTVYDNSLDNTDGCPYRCSNGHLFYYCKPSYGADNEWVDQGKILVLNDETLIIEDHFIEPGYEDYKKATFVRVK